MSNWEKFVKDFASAHNMLYSDALRVAAPYYHQYMDDREKYDNSAPRWKQTRNNSNEKLYQAGVLIGAALEESGDHAQKGALAALLSGLNANISIK